MEEAQLPRVSVVMPAYNAAKYIEESIRSVMEQTFTDYELIIVDDCSKDDTKKIIRDHAKLDKRIVFLQNEKNMGVAATRMNAISIAKGEWIAFLDSDDLWDKRKLEIQMRIIEENPEVQVSYTASSYIDEDGVPYDYVLHAKERTTYKDLLKGNLMSCSSVVIKKNLFQEVGMIHDAMHEDYTAWLTILRKGYFSYGIDQPLLIYRIGKNTKSSNRIKSAKMIYNSYRYIGYSNVMALILMARYTVYSITKRAHIKK